MTQLKADIATQLQASIVHQARTSVGEALHTLQDFYAHSNWVDRSLHELILVPGTRRDKWCFLQRCQRPDKQKHDSNMHAVHSTKSSIWRYHLLRLYSFIRYLCAYHRNAMSWDIYHRFWRVYCHFRRHLHPRIHCILIGAYDPAIPC